MISPFFEKLSEKEEYAKIIFMKVDVDQNPVSMRTPVYRPLPEAVETRVPTDTVTSNCSTHTSVLPAMNPLFSCSVFTTVA